MATQAVEQFPNTSDIAPSRQGRRTTLMLAALGIAAGAVVGLIGLGPVIAPKLALFNGPAVADAPHTTVTHSIENLLLNPAGTGGTRFLAVTATFALRDAQTEQLMRDHEAEVRDRVLSLLGSKSVDELTDMTRRDLLKQQILAVVSPIFPKGAVSQVFLPQFVIQ